MATGAVVDDWAEIKAPHADDWEEIKMDHNPAQGGHAPDNENGSFLHWGGEDLKRSGSFLADEAKGVASGLNPITAVQGIAHSVMHPIDALQSIAHLPSQMKQQYDNGDMEGLAHSIGQLAGQFILGKAGNAIAADPAAAMEGAAKTGTAAKGFVKGAATAAVSPKSIGVHAATYAASQVPGIGSKLAATIEAGNAIAGGIKGAKAELAARAARQTPTVAPPSPSPIPAAPSPASPIAPATVAPSPVVANAPAPVTVNPPPVQAPTVQAPPPAVAPVPTPAPAQATPRIPIWQRTVQPKSLADFARGAKPEADLPAVPSYMQEAFEGDRGGTGIPQEQQARTSIVNALAPKLIQHGIKPEDLNTAEGRAQAAKIAEGIPGLSKNKEFIKSIKEYNPSDTTLDRVQTLMEQWGKFADKFGYKSLGDFKQ